MTDAAPVAEGIDKLREIRQQRAGKRPARKATARKATARKPAGKKESAGKQIAGTVKLVSGLVELRAPVHAEIIRSQADELGEILDRLAAQDHRVAAILDRLTTAVSGTAWVELATWTAGVGGALAVASGIHHPAAVVLGMGMALPAAQEVATRIAIKEAHAAGRVDAAGTAIVDPAAVERIMTELMAPRPQKTDPDPTDPVES